MPSSEDSAPNPDDLQAILRKLDRILDWVEEMRTRGESRHERVARLRSEGKLSKAIATQIQAVLKAENGLTGSSDPGAVSNAWAAVNAWAQEQGCSV